MITPLTEMRLHFCRIVLMAMCHNSKHSLNSMSFGKFIDGDKKKIKRS